MNEVLDVILLRRPMLNYVSPPVCPVIMSGSGSSIMLEAVYGPTPPTGVKLLGQCSRFIVWDSYPDLVCMSLYGVPDSSQMLGAYTSLVECAPAGTVSVYSPGWWRATALTPDGVESLPGDSVLSNGTDWVQVSVPAVAGAVRVNLYKNPDTTNASGTYSLVLSTVSNGAFEVSNPIGCYRLQAITDDGASELSAPICRDATTGCCPEITCSLGYVWDEVQCSCVPGVSAILGPTDSFCVGEAYASQFTTVGGFTPFTWSLVSGTVPPGLTFHTGLFSGNTAPIDGTPTTAGSYTFTVGVSSFGSTYVVQQTFTISGLGVNEYPALPTGTTDTAYSQQLTTGGGTAPYTFSTVSGMPDGLSMDAAGLITGSPYYIGFNSLVVRVTDALGKSCDTLLSLEVVGCPSVVSYPSFDGTDASGAQAPVNAQQFLDASRRLLWAPLRYTSGARNGMGGVVAVSTITNSYVGTYWDNTSGIILTPFSAVYDPVHDVVVFLNRNSGYARFDPGTLLFTTTYIPTVGFPQGNTDCLAVDTQRGNVIFPSHFPGNQYEITRTTKSAFSLLHTSPGMGLPMRAAAYSEGADRFVIQVDGGAFPCYYVDPVTYAKTDSTIAIQCKSSSADHLCTLPGTPWGAFIKQSDSKLVIFDCLTDSVYYDTGVALNANHFAGAAYNNCTGVLCAIGEGSSPTTIKRFNLLTKTYIDTISVGARSIIFDPAANRSYYLYDGNPLIFTSL